MHHLWPKARRQQGKDQDKAHHFHQAGGDERLHGVAAC
jgi:hypothetical protein